MSTYINAIETIVPQYNFNQEDIGKLMLGWIKDSGARRYISKIYKESGISRRHTVVPDFDKSFFKDGKEPGTEYRNRVYIKESAPLYIELAKQLVEQAPGDITHIITASCTGFYNPGADLQIIKELGLSSEIERYHLGFMGCYAAFPALRTAAQFCKANPDAVVLVICLELCTLHLQLNNDLDSIVSNSVFADGAAGVIVSSKDDQKKYEIDFFHSSLVPEGEEDMAWEIGDRGFNMVLSKYVPRILAANLKEMMDSVLEKFSKNTAEIDFWAIHPGGKSILDKVQSSLALPDFKMNSSRDVLKNYGNMSSPTILFVLKDLLEKNVNFNTLAMAFGPGLSVETALLRA